MHSICIASSHKTIQLLRCLMLNNIRRHLVCLPFSTNVFFDNTLDKLYFVVVSISHSVNCICYKIPP